MDEAEVKVVLLKVVDERGGDYPIRGGRGGGEGGGGRGMLPEMERREGGEGRSRHLASKMGAIRGLGIQAECSRLTSLAQSSNFERDDHD